ncbi:DUF2617 family protein [Actinomadura hibisca]|uniref:DUF2617 family protein n=1 Tax=Actinomadura hibisca TaxID=68565 RepID=UPI00082A05F9|nr:DUF2617 family protein [Actinomadura hibisca]
MRAALDTPYSDTRADELTFVLGLPPLEALATLAVERAGHRVLLRLLGASHQVLVGAPDDADFSETVACLPGHPGPLPSRVERQVAGWSYDFRAETAAHHRDGDFVRAVDAARRHTEGRDDALTGTFPGSPHALTALALDPAGLAWRTWHAYPQTREIVMTWSRLEPRP